MFDLLRNFIADPSSGAERAGGYDDGDYRLATAALLIHVAKVDGAMDDAESARLHEVIEDRFGLDRMATDRLIASAERSDAEAVDFYHFTSVLKRALDDKGRRRIIEMMWDVVFADGAVSEFEENVVFRVAELLGVSTRDRVLLRRKVEHEPHATASDTGMGEASSGPWSQSAGD